MKLPLRRGGGRVSLRGMSFPPEESERMRRLEEKIAYLERHVVAQDRAMFEMAERIDALDERLKQVGERVQRGAGDDDLPADERPPHY